MCKTADARSSRQLPLTAEVSDGEKNEMLSVQGWAEHTHTHTHTGCTVHSGRLERRQRNQYCALYFIRLSVHLFHFLSTAVLCFFSPSFISWQSPRLPAYFRLFVFHFTSYPLCINFVNSSMKNKIPRPVLSLSYFWLCSLLAEQAWG